MLILKVGIDRQLATVARRHCYPIEFFFKGLLCFLAISFHGDILEIPDQVIFHRVCAVESVRLPACWLIRCFHDGSKVVLKVYGVLDAASGELNSVYLLLMGTEKNNEVVRDQ